MKKIILLSATALFFSCKEVSKNVEVQEVKTEKEVVQEVPLKGNSFTQSIEKAHNKTKFLSNKAVSYDLKVAFGGNTILDGTITQLTNGAKIRLDDHNDGSKVIFDNKEVFISPSDANDPMARFHIFTWSYFFSLPYKLTDNGTVIGSTVSKKWGEDTKETAKLSFTAGTGDAPKDWYVIYKDQSSNILEGAAYIVSYGKDVAQAEKEPHAIKYSNFTTVEGIPFATKWTYHMWTDLDGYGDKIGEATLSNIKFLDNTKELFNKPENSKILEAPVE